MEEEDRNITHGAKEAGLEPESFCPIRQTLKILGKKWTILIIKEIYYSKDHEIGFMDIKNGLFKISTKVLSQRRKEMQEEDVIYRRVDASKTPIRVYYSLTPKGDDACNIITDLKKYGLKWGDGDFTCHEIDCELCDKKREIPA